jgi:hypothetical protein
MLPGISRTYVGKRKPQPLKGASLPQSGKGRFADHSSAKESDPQRCQVLTPKKALRLTDHVRDSALRTGCAPCL